MLASAKPQIDLKQYFTDALEVNSAMAQLLGNVDGLNILEPSVGNGALLSGLNGTPQRVDAIDVDPMVLAHTKQRFQTLNIYTHHADFIDISTNDGLFGKSAKMPATFDAVISNPPFGLYFSAEYRRKLKSILPGMYVRESYGLFLIFSIMKLSRGGRYVFLLPDTFLTSKNHASLRHFLIEKTSLSNIIRFPSKRFETVNFGYGNLCIISGTKKPPSDEGNLLWTEAFSASEPLISLDSKSTSSFSMKDLHNNVDTGWRSSMSDTRSDLKDWTTLGQIADCKTGIYTGDNERFIGFDPRRISKRLNGHAIEWNVVHCGQLTTDEKAQGLSGEANYVQLIRGGHRAFNEASAWAIRWDEEAINFYKTNKKARLQNSTFYFRPGIAVPMVTARRISASLMDNAVFDQGVVGVFPKKPEAREALLLYINSSIATALRNDIVNGGANNSANYLKRLPVPSFDDCHHLEAKHIVSKSIVDGYLDSEVCDTFVEQFITKQGS